MTGFGLPQGALWRRILWGLGVAWLLVVALGVVVAVFQSLNGRVPQLPPLIPLFIAALFGAAPGVAMMLIAQPVEASGATPPEEALWRRVVFAFGVLWLLLTGLCTAGFVLWGTADMGSQGVETFGSMLLFFLLIGALCMAPGLVLVLAARKAGR